VRPEDVFLSEAVAGSLKSAHAESPDRQGEPNPGNELIDRFNLGAAAGNFNDII
jgi:hypothetical protein